MANGNAKSMLATRELARLLNVHINTVGVGATMKYLSLTGLVPEATGVFLGMISLIFLH